MEEIWKDIPKYEGLYQASNLGRIKTIIPKTFRYSKLSVEVIKERLLTQVYSRGYLNVHFSNEGPKSAHRLVALAFITNPKNKPYVNHINGLKDDNRIENLEWTTESENVLHSLYKLGNIKSCKKGGEHIQSKKVYQYSIKGELLKIWESLSSIELAGINYDYNISDCCNGRSKSSSGFVWSFTELSQEYFKTLQIGQDYKKKPISKISLDGEILDNYDSIYRTKEYGFDPKQVSEVCNGRRKIYKGFHWSFN
jgi:hypothetical protein